MALPDWLALSTVFGVVMLLVGGVALGVSTRYLWRASTVYRATAVETLDGVRPATAVRITGIVEGGEESLTAPFSGEPCVAIRATIEERRLSPVLLPWDVAIHELSAARPFGIRTDGGIVEVSEPMQTVTLSRQSVGTVARTARPPERIRAYESRANSVPATSLWRDPPTILRPVVDFLGLGRRRYSEQRVAHGDTVTVVGRVRADGRSVDPLVVSDRSRSETIWRMAKTTVAGVLVGVIGILLGTMILLLG